jgi:hypothetical protein
LTTQTDATIAAGDERNRFFELTHGETSFSVQRDLQS